LRGSVGDFDVGAERLERPGGGGVEGLKKKKYERKALLITEKTTLVKTGRAKRLQTGARCRVNQKSRRLL